MMDVDGEGDGEIPDTCIMYRVSTYSTHHPGTLQPLQPLQLSLPPSPPSLSGHLFRRHE